MRKQTAHLQFHIHKKNSSPLGSGEPRGYAPMHEARTLDEFEEISSPVLVEQTERGWKTSRKIPVILFVGALLLFFGITYIAREFESEENLQGIVIEGNGGLLNSEILSLASIDTKQKFYDID